MKKFLLVGLLAALAIAPTAWANDISNGSYSTTDGGNNAAPPNGWPAGMFPNQVEPSARANMGATARWWERANAKLSTTGAAGAYVITPSNTSYPTAYTQGEVYCGKANFTSVGNDTLNVNGLGAKAIYSISHGSLARIQVGDILTGSQFCATYDGALNTGAGGFQVQSEGAFAVTTNGGTAPLLTLIGSAPLPGGLMVQFGYILAPGPAGTTVTLPSAFPHGLIGSHATVQMSGSVGHFASTYPVDAQHFQISSTVTGSFQVFWTAYGY